MPSKPVHGSAWITTVDRNVPDRAAVLQNLFQSKDNRKSIESDSALLYR
jgi:hypothetical protein